jgi:3',5'-cyclic-nucleotide phosphodiesterase
VYATRETHDFLQRHLLDGGLYPNFTQIPSPEKPRLRQISLEPGKEHTVCGFRVTPIPVEHSVPAVGYHIASPNGDSFFFTGDTNGAGLAEMWESLDPNLVILEVTYPNSQESLASQVFHLTPSRVEKELLKLQNSKGGRPLPPLVAIHLDPMAEQDISAELMALADKLGASIVTGREDMVVEV